VAIDLEDRLRRALELAHSDGYRSPAASRAVIRELASRANGLAVADPASADVFIALATELDASGRAIVDTAPPKAIPTIVVLDDDGTLVVESKSANAVQVVGCTFRRGTLRFDKGRFVLVEVEEDVSAREVQAEAGVPMFADEKLIAFR